MDQPGGEGSERFGIAKMVEEKAAAYEAERRARIKRAADEGRRALYVALGWDPDRIEAILKESPTLEFPSAIDMEDVFRGIDKCFDEIAQQMIDAGIDPGGPADAPRPPGAV
jgi:hypothetical protein